MGRLILSLHFHSLARRPDVRRFGRRWDVVLRVDGTEHVFEEGPRQVVEVTAGHHEVEVVFRPTGFASLARLLGLRYGRERIAVEVPDNGEVTLEYHGGMFWTFGDHTLRRAS
jgi:hypothetical protein